MTEKKKITKQELKNLPPEVREALKKDLRRELLKRSYFEFFKFFWPVIIPDPLLVNWHIKKICDELQKLGEAVEERRPYPDLVINVPPSESKSTICTVIFPVWLWIRDPTARIISGSYASTLSKNLAIKSRDILRSSLFLEYFSGLFDMKSDQDNKSHYVNDKGGERLAVSVGSAVTGFHAHLILIDDPINPKQAESEAELLTANRWIFETLSTRKVSRELTPTVLILQRLSKSDPTALYLERKKNLIHICLPSELTEDIRPVELVKEYEERGGLLNPIRSGREVLDNIRKELGSRSYASQFLQSPTELGGNIIKSDWFKKYNKEDIDITGTSFYVDTAYTSKSTNDPTAILAYKQIGNLLYLVNCIAVRKEFPELIKFLITFVHNNGYNNKSRIYIEPKASGLSVIQQLKRETGLNVISDTPPKDSKLVRLTSVSPIIEAGRVLIPALDNWVNEFIEEVSAFPNGKHDDKTDTLIGAINKTLIKKSGLSSFVTL